MRQYSPQKIEQKWQKIWRKTRAHQTNLESKKPYYCLDMFPYPSGEGLHVGHWKGYVLSDVWVRYKRMQGYDVLHPMGWDAFGLPAENAAIEKGIHPKKFTQANLKMFKKQLNDIGAMYDWSLEINTSRPEYYKWTQWIFLQLYKNDLAYRKKAPVNWCPSCKTVLANEQIIAGKCERCGQDVTTKYLKQWFFRITKYADPLIDDLEKIDWPEKVKTMQKNWIGRSGGVEVEFKAKVPEKRAFLTARRRVLYWTKPKELTIPVFTTRPDTLFGTTYLVLAPEHPLVKVLTTKDKKEEVSSYIEKTKKEREIERISEEKEKTGVFISAYALNPVNNQKIPIWISDYVLPTYGTGAIMCVPAHDKRDFAFAKKFKLPIVQVISPTGKETKLKEAYVEEGKMINSGEFDGIKSEQAEDKITDWLKKKNLARQTVNYRFRDWLISRQRYWGCPIPIIFCEKCGEVPVDEKDLPVRLPKIKDYKPLEGESPLARSSKFVDVVCPGCGGMAQREIDTMDTFVDSAWYFLRYPSAHIRDKAFDEELTKRWLPIDAYIGGIEHATGHLIFFRFMAKALKDLKLIDFDEPAQRLFNQGMIYYKGAKMSKSKGNVISPDPLIKKYGRDSIRGYELFMGPPEQDIEWSDQGVPGVYRFLQKVWNLVTSYQSATSQQPNKELEQLMHGTIKKVTEDLERFHLNTVVSALMEYTNQLTANNQQLSTEHLETLLLLLAPIAPHLSCELWQKLGHKESIFKEKWPKYKEELAKAEKIELVIQVNGKVRDKIEVEAEIQEEKAKEIALASQKVQKFTEGKKIIKTIFVPGKLINIVVD